MHKRAACVQNSFLPARRLSSFLEMTPSRVTAGPATRERGFAAAWVLPSPLGQFAEAQEAVVSSFLMHPTK